MISADESSLRPQMGHVKDSAENQMLRIGRRTLPVRISLVVAGSDVAEPRQDTP